LEEVNWREDNSRDVLFSYQL